jgi:three-Cys-motif partner protein
LDADCKKANGLCTAAKGPDGLSVQCIAGHSLEKHDYLRRYIQASAGPRSYFLRPRPKVPAPGGAAFIDLFAGPGMVRERRTADILSGSPLLALEHTGAPFTKVLLCDADREVYSILSERVQRFSQRATVFHGDSNALIDEAISQIPPYGLNVTLIDPFAIRALKFETIAKLAAFRYMDLIIHFPVHDIRRNYQQQTEAITAAVGTDRWRGKVRLPEEAHLLMEYLREELGRFRYVRTFIQDALVTQRTNVPLYYLMYLTKHEKGADIWNSIMRIDAKGQRGLDY